MSAIASSFIGSAIKAAVFAVIAYVGIICGKKFRDSKTKKALESQE